MAFAGLKKQINKANQVNFLSLSRKKYSILSKCIGCVSSFRKWIVWFWLRFCPLPTSSYIFYIYYVGNKKKIDSTNYISIFLSFSLNLATFSHFTLIGDVFPFHTNSRVWRMKSTITKKIYIIEKRKNMLKKTKPYTHRERLSPVSSVHWSDVYIHWVLYVWTRPSTVSCLSIKWL